MRHLLAGVALAALLAAGSPAGAQTSTTPPAAPHQAKTAVPHHPAKSKHVVKHKRMAKRHTSPWDNAAERLNREEIERVQKNAAQTRAGAAPAPVSGTSAAPSNGTPFPNAGANSMPGTVTSGASGHSKEEPQQ